MSTRTLAAALAFLTLACVPPPSDSGAEKASDEAKTEESAKDDADAAEAKPKPESPEPKAAANDGVERDENGLIIAEPAPPLSEEQKQLIAAEPSTLTKEQRRKRAHALRQKIMQDPTSSGAQSLLEGAAAIKSGDMQVPANLKQGGDSGLTVYPPQSPDAPAAPEK